MPTVLRHVFRRLSHAPVFTAVTLITLAIGIGANTAIFSVINGVLLKPLPYPEPERLVGVWETATGMGLQDVNASPATYFTFREEGRTFQDIGLWRGEAVTVTGLAEPERVEVLAVTDGTLPILGVQPERGRWFSRKDDSPGSPETVMLTHGYWQRRFGGDASVIGRRIMVNGRAREIIGIMPRDFRFMDMKSALIIPFQLNRNESFIGNFSYQAVARLAPGATIQQANADVARMLPIMETKFKPAPGMSLDMLRQIGMGPNVRPLQYDVVGDVGKVLWVLMATVGMVLLIACANVANLLLVRADGRRQELAIRAALGAGRSDIARELLVESACMGVMGGALGLGLAWTGLRALVSAGPANLPRLDEISIDWRVLLFTMLISLAAGVLFGLIPVFKYAGPRIGTFLRDGGRTVSQGRQRHRARAVLVVVQVALALVLLISSGLMIRTMQAMRHVAPGFTSPEEIQTLRVSIPESQAKEPDRVVRMQSEIARKIAAVPGVTSVGLTNSITMDGYTDNDPLFVQDRPEANTKMPPLRRYKFITPGYFQAMGNPLLAGREFTWTDLFEQRPVVLISENVAREYWGTPGAAIGKMVRETTNARWREIIGVSGNEHDDGVHKKASTIVYWPMIVQDFWGQKVIVQRTAAFAVRTSRAGSASLLNDLRQAVWSVNPDLPLADVRTVSEIYRRSMARTSFTLVMLGIAAGMALLLGVVGIYGVISYSIAQRTREIGIRMALGASSAMVRRMFVRHGLMLTGAGVVCGAGAAFALTRLMTSLLFEVSPVDPATYLAVSVVLISAAALASYLPAHRATAIEPVEALRTE